MVSWLGFCFRPRSWKLATCPLWESCTAPRLDKILTSDWAFNHKIWRYQKYQMYNLKHIRGIRIVFWLSRPCNMIDIVLHWLSLLAIPIFLCVLGWRYHLTWWICNALPHRRFYSGKDRSGTGRIDGKEGRKGYQVDIELTFIKIILHPNLLECWPIYGKWEERLELCNPQESIFKKLYRL